MTDDREVKKGLSRDTALYLIAKILEGIIGFVALSVYTKLFVPQEFGQYNTINVTVMTASLVFLGWLLQSIFRFVNEYDQKESLEKFYSSAFYAWLLVNLVTVAIGGVTIIILGSYIEPTFTRLAWLSLGMFVSWNSSQILLSLLAAQRRIKLNLSLSLFAIVAKIALLLSLVKIYGAKVELLVITSLVVDGLVAVIIASRIKLLGFVSRRAVSRDVIIKFFHYGVPLLGIGISASLLNVSDRYIILYFLGAEQVGIYSANYTLASAAFTMILTAVMRGVYPVILRTWQGNNREETEAVLSQAVRYFLLISLPAFIGIAVLSNWMSSLILEKSYTEGFEVITWVALGMVLLGLTEYNNKAWELSSQTKFILKFSFASAMIKVILTIIFVPLWGYQAAAIATALAYLFYYIVSYWAGREILSWHLPMVTYARTFLSVGLMAVSLWLFISIVELSWISLMFAVILGAIIYFITLLLTKEIQQEVTVLTGWLKRRRGAKT